MCQYAFRSGGITVFVCNRHPQGLMAAEYKRVMDANPKAKTWNWRPMLRDASVYVRDRVWHPDHKTVVLDDWHRVLMNTENQAPGVRAVVFLD